jgi:hypothetical protein
MLIDTESQQRRLNMTGLKVGDKFYSVRFNGHGHTYTNMVVTKVTPKGFVDGRYEHNELAEPIRYNPQGVEIGDSYRKSEIDSMPYDERTAELAKEERAKKAANAVAKVINNCNCNLRWGKEGMLAELDKLQAELNAARELVNNI